MEPAPGAEYTRRLEARRAACEARERAHRRIGNARVAVALGGVVMVWLAIVERALPLWWLLAPLALSIALAVAHDRVLRIRDRARRAVQHYEHALARVENRWMGTGNAGERYIDAAHPYAQDLDVFGEGSLFQLLSIARTPMGEHILADWLRAPGATGELRARQQAVEELRPRLDLREDLAVLGEEARVDVHPEALAAWGEAPSALDSRLLRATATLITLLTLAAAVVWAVAGERVFFLVTLLAAGAFIWRTRETVNRVIHGVESAAHRLATLALVLARLERERFTSPRLARLRADLEAGGGPPSARIARLNRLMELLDSRDNLVMRLIGPPLLYTTHLAFAVEGWRRRSGPALRRWLAAAGEIEALGSLAGYAYEHPADVFPELVEEGPLLEGEGLAHPFLPEDRAVRNPVSLGGEGARVLVVSGSNMSGKSTLLRTLGVNAVLAQAGGTVRARRLRISPLQVGASIRIVDSLQAGSSRFYAEITRLRQIVELTGAPRPVLFLLDEFLHGTNSHDRRIGAEAIVRGLADRGAIGLMTTHDLALAHIAEALAGRGANVHFEDRFEDGKLHFDYVMRPGVVRKSNALELMRSVGLEV
ncbi:MAG: DNA mismatch repair protein MutS [Bryobacteraceae bacterium]